MSAYPLTLRFRILTLGQTIEGTDVSGAPVCFVKQKAFRLREDVAVFRDPSQSEQIYRMRADRIIDIGARYDITDPSGMPVGAVKQRGGSRSSMRSSARSRSWGSCCRCS